MYTLNEVMPMIGKDTIERYDNALYAIYEADNLLAVRTAFLKACETLVPHLISWFDLIGNDRGHRVFFAPFSLNMDREQLKDYYEHFLEVDYTSWIQAQPESRPVYRDSDFITSNMREKSVLYREWLKPMNAVYGMSMIIEFGDVSYGTVTLGRSEDQGDFLDRELSIATMLERHLAQRLHQLWPQGFDYAAGIHLDDALIARYHLTPREIEIGRLLADGATTIDIANGLCISPNTLKRHIANIYRKMGVSARFELTRILDNL